MRLISYTEVDGSGREWARKSYIGDNDEETPENLNAGIPFLRDLDLSGFNVDDLHLLINNFLVGFGINSYAQWESIDYNTKQRLGLTIAHRICDNIIKKSLT